MLNRRLAQTENQLQELTIAHAAATKFHKQQRDELSDISKADKQQIAHLQHALDEEVANRTAAEREAADAHETVAESRMADRQTHAHAHV